MSAREGVVGAGRRSRPAAAVAWLVAFLVTRAPAVALTLHPTLYGAAVSDPTGDVARYAGWVAAIVGDGHAAYVDVDIEYPPGVLPFVLLPGLLRGGELSVPVFVGLLVLVDLAGLAALVVTGRRGGGRGGAVTWLVLPPLLGAVLYGRLDLLPAVGLLLGLERARAGRWATAGVWMGLATAAKLVPVLVLPLVAVAAHRHWPRVAGGAALGLAAACLPHLARADAVWHDVVGYHVGRALHLESTWGSVLNLRRVAGGPHDVVYDHAAFGIAGPGAAAALAWSAVLGVAVPVLVTAVARVRWRDDRWRARAELPLAATAMTALLLAAGPVLSPQYVVWLLAVGALAVTATPRAAWWLAPLLSLVTVLTVAGYPFGFDQLRAGATWPAAALVLRNVSVIVVGVGCLACWTGVGRTARRSVARPVSVPVSSRP